MHDLRIVLAGRAETEYDPMAAVGLETLRNLRDEYGDIVSMQRPNGRLAYFVNDPVEVRKLLVKQKELQYGMWRECSFHRI